MATPGFLNNCAFRATAGGTGSLTVSAALPGAFTPAQAGSVDTTITYRYHAQSDDLTQWEFGTCTFSSSGTVIARTVIGSSNANALVNFTAAPAVFITFVADDLASIVYNIATALTAAQQNTAQKNLGLGTAIRDYIAGLAVQAAGGTNTLTVSPGVAADTVGADIMTLSSSLMKTTGAWVVGNNNGALDTGVIANSTWYHVFLIKRIDTQVVDVLISLSLLSPTLPANYTISRRIGSRKTDSSGNWVACDQRGDENLWVTPPNNISTTTLGTTSTLFTLADIPPGLRVWVIIRVAVLNAGTVNVLVQSPDETTQAVGTPSGNFNLSGPAGLYGSGLLIIRSDTSQRIRAVSSAASTTLYGVIVGFIDRRGKDD